MILGLKIDERDTDECFLSTLMTNKTHAWLILMGWREEAIVCEYETLVILVLVEEKERK